MLGEASRAGLAFLLHYRHEETVDTHKLPGGSHAPNTRTLLRGEPATVCINRAVPLVTAPAVCVIFSARYLVFVVTIAVTFPQ